ncbi:MAG: hypothetical protein ABII18_05715 [bacterium]|nr:hypothetical protein [bacterium]MBU1919168.1 hypothetical protein [bacterium]
MKFVLRIFSFFTMLAVLSTVMQVVMVFTAVDKSNIDFTSGLMITTFLGWGVIIIIGPYAAIQLWRLKNIGRILTMVLLGLPLLYYSYTLLFYSTKQTLIVNIVIAMLINLLALAVLMLPASKRICLNKTPLK